MLTRILAGSAVTAFFAAVVISIAALQERDGLQTAALAGRTQQPAATEASAAFSTAQPGVLTRRAASRPGYDRITSVDGGWSFEIPTEWSAESAPMRGAEIGSFDFRKAELANAPAADQLRVRVQLVTDYDLTPLEKFGARDVPQWLVVGQTRATVGGRDAVRTVKNAFVPAGSPFDQQHVVWDFRSPFLSDRIVAFDAWPANGVLAVEAEHAIATFELFAPPLVMPTAPKISRPVAVARAAEYAGTLGTVGGSTAKLVLFKEYDRAQIDEAKRVGGPYAMGGATDPDQLLWIVVVRGDFEQMGVSRPQAPPGYGATFAPPPKLVWLAVIVNAIDGNVLNYVPGTRGDGPGWFDTLVDRAR